MHFAEAVAAFEIQLQANQRSRHTVRSYRRDLGMLRAWLERESHPLLVERITPPLLLQFAASRACTHPAGVLVDCGPLQAGHDSQVANGTTLQSFESRLISGALMASRGPLDAGELDNHRALKLP